MFRISIAVACLFALTACGSGDENASTALDDVQVSEEATPAVEVENLSLDEPGHRVITEGDGDVIESGDAVSVEILTVNGTTGDELENSFLQEGTETIVLTEGSLRPSLLEAVLGQQVGVRVLVAVPLEENDANQGQRGLESGDVLVFVIDVVEKAVVLDSAEGEAEELPDSVPPFGFEDGQPTGFTDSDAVPEEVTEAQAHVAIRGEGPQVEAGQTVSVHYHGQLYPDGEVFDSSWERGQPTDFPIGTGNVIACWDEGIVGQTVGSRLILVCPSDSAYGDQGSPPTIQPGDTLIFAVDLLAAY